MEVFKGSPLMFETALKIGKNKGALPPLDPGLRVVPLKN